MPASPSLLEARGISRTYELGLTRVPALRSVDLQVGQADFVVLEGPSGSGKTTLINLLGLLDRPDAGAILLDGESVAGLDEVRRSDVRRDRMGFVFQSFNLVPVLTAAENVEYPLTLRPTPAAERRRRAHELLERVGLAGKEAVRPDLLSGGERQRVAIARALANAPQIVLADEPTASLDSRTAAGILDLLSDLNRERGITFVVATHDPRVVERARRVVTLRDGAIVGAA
jgi:putative ABC transport system ATP-binding protein